MAAQITKGTKELLRDIRSPKLIPGIIQGLIIGAIIVIVEISFANVIFSGSLSPLATRAAGMCIFGAGALCLATGLLSPFSTLISLPQDTPVAILSVVAATIVTTIPAASSDILYATVSATMISSALLTGLFFWIIGKFKLSTFARFLPFPVIGGFLAGSGVMLLIGSFGVMTQKSLTWDNLTDFLTLDMVSHWGPGIAFALCVFLLMRTCPHFMILPGSMLAGMIVFFLGIYILDIPIDQIRDQGWMPATMPSGQLWPGFTAETVTQIDWPTLFSQLPNILTICLLSLIGMILNINGIELGSQQDIDLDQELKGEAFGNVITGLGGGFAGYGTLSLSMLGPRSNLNSRIIPVTAALLCLCVIFLGAEALTYIPKPLLGGLLFLLGLFCIDEWIFTGWKRLTPSDYLIVIAIVLTIINQGFLLGVGLGLILTTIIFLVRFTRIPVIRGIETVATLRSLQERSVPDRIVLKRDGKDCVILKLSGYLFFGSTYFIGRKIKDLFEQQSQLQSLILDLTQVQGFDISAMNTLQRIAQQSLPRGIRIAVSSPPAGLMALIQRNASPEAFQKLNVYANLDDALKSSEDQILAKHQQVLAHNSTDGHEARELLFNAAVDDLDAQLLEQERFEELLEKMDRYLSQKNVRADEVLVKEGQQQQSIIFILWGSISLVVTDSAGEERKLASLGSGKMIAPKAAWKPWSADYTARAEHPTMVAIMSNEAMASMEAEVPQVAMAMYKYMAETLANEC